MPNPRRWGQGWKEKDNTGETPDGVQGTRSLFTIAVHSPQPPAHFISGHQDLERFLSRGANHPFLRRNFSSPPTSFSPSSVVREELAGHMTTQPNTIFPSLLGSQAWPHDAAWSVDVSRTTSDFLVILSLPSSPTPQNGRPWNNHLRPTRPSEPQGGRGLGYRH